MVFENTPTVSVIIPAFNEENMLTICLSSLSQIDWPKENLQVIVVDNGSTDNTCQVARSMGAMVLKDPDATVAGLRNLGAQRAQGRFLAFVDADCTVAGDWLKSASRYFNDDKIVAWGGPPEVPDNATWVQKTWHVLRKKSKDVQEVDWLESMNLFVKKETFDRVGGFDSTLVTCEDVDLSYRLSSLGRIVADRSIRMVHLGEAATLRQFVIKELWRGQDNLRGVFAHGFSLKELLSLAVPLYFGIFLPVICIAALASGTPVLICSATIAGGLPGLLVLLKTRAKKVGVILKIQLVWLSYIYFLVRTLAVLIPRKP
jgi:glycosyltransferase involved in cell wall biosynthesis